jgi:circadian clock protein KaiC
VRPGYSVEDDVKWRRYLLQAGEQPAMTRQAIGIEGLDALLDGGLPEGNTILVQGAPGTGKSVLGLQFLYEGAVRFGAPGLLVTFEEHPGRLYRDAVGLGWDYPRLEQDGLLHIVFTSPAVFLKDVESDHYGRLAREFGLKRVVVDSMTQLDTLVTGEDVRVRCGRVINGLRRDGMMVMLIREVSTRDTPSLVTPEEYVSDTIVALDYRPVGAQRARLIEVLKHRGSAHSSFQHQFALTTGGMQIDTAGELD